MGYNQTKMAHIRRKWQELDQIFCKKLRIKEKSDLIGQNKPIKVKINLISQNQPINVKIDRIGQNQPVKFFCLILT